MAETDSTSCRCSNISIMQLFHELKQRFPKVPDQIVSKIIQENYHNKAACATLLERESSFYAQSYPGALISGETRLQGPSGPISDHCTAGGSERWSSSRSSTKSTSPQRESGGDGAAAATALPTSQQQTDSDVSSRLPLSTAHAVSARTPQHDPSSPSTPLSNVIESTPTDDAMGVRPQSRSLHERLELAKIPLGQLVRQTRERLNEAKGCDISEFCVSELNEISVAHKSASPTRPTTLSCDIAYPISHTSSRAENISGRKSLTKRFTPPASSLPPSPNRLAPPTISNPFLSSHSYPNRLSASFNDLSTTGSSLNFNDTTAKSSETPKEYEVAVKCVVCPSAPGDQQRSFTSVNLTLRSPSADTTLPIDITSGQSLTYTTASFDPRQGYQSHLQIRIGPAGGSVTACRTRVSSPIVRTASRSPCRGGAVCQSRHHVRELLKQQRERKDLLARELKRGKERLRDMQTQVQSLKMDLARVAARPLILSKLKADIERLRCNCERLAAAVDTYQNNQNNLPLGETDEDFYRNIYTGQRQQRAGWSCRVCTFRNHPLLAVCEECEMPRLSLGSPSADPQLPSVPHVLSNPVFPNNNTLCAAGETSTSVSRTITPLQER